MKNLLILFLSFALMSFNSHKFYVAIHQINYADEKRMLQITSRIFIDDLNAALEQKYKSKTMFGEKEESAADVDFLKKYLAAHFIINIDGKPVRMEYLSHEYEANVIILYLRVTNISGMRKLAVRNSVLVDYVTDQQNIIQTTVYGEKQSAVLTADDLAVEFKIGKKSIKS